MYILFSLLLFNISKLVLFDALAILILWPPVTSKPRLQSHGSIKASARAKELDEEPTAKWKWQVQLLQLFDMLNSLVHFHTISWVH